MPQPTRNIRNRYLSLLIGGGLLFLSHFVFKGEIARQDRWQMATKTHYQMGARPLYNTGRYKDAIPELNRCLSIVPNFVPGINLRGKAYAMLGEYNKAQMDFKRLISLRPRTSQGYRGLGFIYLLQGETDKARPFLTKALALAPHDKKVKEALEDLR